MNNKQQSAETKPQKSTEAQVTNDSHSNGNTHVGCSPLVVTNLKEDKITVIDLLNTISNALTAYSLHGTNPKAIINLELPSDTHEKFTKEMKAVSPSLEANLFYYGIYKFKISIIK
jgi:hypothetical protein